MNIGESTRLDTIKKWNDGVKKNTDLLLAFPLHELNDEPLERFRAVVADRIKALSNYLATGTWDIFLGTELREPPTKEEREAMAAEDAARAEAEANAAAAGEIIDAVSTSPLALPEPKCCHFDGGCNCPEITDDAGKDCDGCKRECAFFQLNPGAIQQAAENPDEPEAPAEGEETVGGIPKEAFDEAKKDIERRKCRNCSPDRTCARTGGRCYGPCEDWIDKAGNTKPATDDGQEG